MTVFFFLVGLALIAVTAWLLVHALTLPRTRFQLHLKQIEQYGFVGGTTEPEITIGAEEPTHGVSRSVFEAIGRATTAVIPWLKPLDRKQLAAAGMYEMSPEAVHGFRALSAVSLFVLVLAIKPSFTLTWIVVLIAAPIAGWTLPGLVIKQRGRQRLDAIDRDLPRLIDALIATIEAGMGFAGSLQLISTRFKGPMGIELRLMRREQGLGISTEQALDNLVNRCDTPSVRAFTRSLVHGQELGVSIGPMLRNIAVDIRRRRRQAAREKVQKAPLKLLFPLIILIFPALLVVILYPALYAIVHALTGG